MAEQDHVPAGGQLVQEDEDVGQGPAEAPRRWLEEFRVGEEEEEHGAGGEGEEQRRGRPGVSARHVLPQRRDRSQVGTCEVTERATAVAHRGSKFRTKGNEEML